MVHKIAWDSEEGTLWGWIRPLFSIEKLSDVHLKGAEVWIRVNGEMRRTEYLAPETFQREIEGKFGRDGVVDIEGVPIRFHTAKDVRYGAMSIRMLPPKVPTIEGLCLPEVICEIASMRQGLVTIGGKTNSGKTTTLGAIVNKINETRSVNIVTIEDPVEILHKPIRSCFTQKNVLEDQSVKLERNHLSEIYAEAIREVLREDADVVVVGETRDNLAMEAVLSGTERGGMVFTTLHTDSVPKTFHRIINAFEPSERYQIKAQMAMLLKAVVVQALVPSVDGKGRAMLMEYAVIDDGLRNLIRDSDDQIHKIRAYVQAKEMQGDQGFRTFQTSARLLMEEGRISPEIANGYFSRNNMEQKTGR